MFSAALSAQTPLELSLITFNIRYDNPADPLLWDNRKEEVTKAIAFFDIVGLQEALPNQLEDLQSKMPWMSVYSETRFGNGEGEACPIMLLQSFLFITKNQAKSFASLIHIGLT